jgi:hypothetical protein
MKAGDGNKYKTTCRISMRNAMGETIQKCLAIANAARKPCLEQRMCANLLRDGHLVWGRIRLSFHCISHLRVVLLL